MTFPDPVRRDIAKVRRVDATDMSTRSVHPIPEENGDEAEPFIFNFTKGLEHSQNGLLANVQSYLDFKSGTEVHDPMTFAQTVPYRGDFIDDTGAPFAGAFRRWESPTAGHAYVMEGPDPFAVTMPPAPKVGSAEFAAEMAECYQMALGREWGVAALMDPGLVGALKVSDGVGALSQACKKRITDDCAAVQDAADRISGMRWFAGTEDDGQTDQLLKDRRRFGVTQAAGNLFRGVGEDCWATPFVSQFMVMGSGGGMRDAQKRASGMVQYGAQRIAQTVRIATPEKDYMTKWSEWLNVQNGYAVKLAPKDEFQNDDYRPLARLRDLATYVHFDQLYQAYLNAALILLDEQFPSDPGIPYHGAAINKFPFPGASAGDTNRMPFALFGGPHLLTLVTEVSSRALKAVRLQKFSVHRRLRPEAAGALFHTVYTGYQPDRNLPGSTAYATAGQTADAMARQTLGSTVARYTFPTDGPNPGTDMVLEQILTDVRLHNAAQNGTEPSDLSMATWLLPMAFPEGSPMHPAYGAGHATVAGACVTLLKAFFAMTDPDDATKPVFLVDETKLALVPDCGTKPSDPTIDLLSVAIEKGLTLEGELNKLMWNISNARNIAGVHYYTDYIESAQLGEAITLGILREQMLCYHPAEQVTMTVPLLVPRTLPACLLSDSSIGETDVVAAVRILSDGTLEPAMVTPGRDEA
ncbi:MAG: hypothetical protein AB8B51_14200 [Sedimentitalea sp.]